MRNLRHLALFLTESCNLACTYCFAANMEGRHIDEQLARRAIDLLLSTTSPEVELGLSFWGGEPLTCFDMLTRLVGYAEERARAVDRQVALSLPTNLTLLTDEIIDFLQEHEVRPSLSCDGGERSQSLRRMRSGESSFPLVCEKLELIGRRYAGRLPGVRMTVSPATLRDFSADVEFFLERGFDQIYFAPVVEASWTDADLRELDAQQRKLAQRWGELLVAGRRVCFNTWDKILARREFIRRGQLAPEQRLVCGAGRSMLAVDVYGDLYPCQRFVFYDKVARSSSLGSIATEGDPAPLRIDTERLGTTTKRCSACDDLPRCAPVCPALNYRLTGELHTVDERLCRLNASEERLVSYLESLLGEEPAFRAYIDEFLMKVFTPSTLSASTRSLFAGVGADDVDRLAERASAILEGLTQRGQPAGPTGARGR